MTWITIGIGLSLSIIFAITNAVSYQRGNTIGYNEGFETGVAANIQKIKEGEYKIEWEEEEHRR